MSSSSSNRSARSSAICAAAAAAAAAALLHGDLQLVVLLGVLQQLQRALLGRQRARRPSAPSALPSADFISAAAFGSASAILLNPSIDDAEARLELADELFDLLAQLRLRQVQEDDVLAELVRPSASPCRAPTLNVAGDDLALLPRQLADLLAAAAATAAAIACDCAGL